MPSVLFPVIFLFSMMAAIFISACFAIKRKETLSIAIIWAVIFITMAMGMKELSPMVGLIFIVPIAVWGFITWLHYSTHRKR